MPRLGHCIVSIVRAGFLTSVAVGIVLLWMQFVGEIMPESIDANTESKKSGNNLNFVGQKRTATRAMTTQVTFSKSTPGPRTIDPEDCRDLWKIAEDLRNFWLHTLHVALHDNSTLALHDGYCSIHERIMGIAVSTRDGHENKSLQQLLSEFEAFWDFLQFAAKKKELDLSVDEINEIYRRMQSILATTLKKCKRIQEVVLKKLEKDTHRKLYALQHPKACSSARIMVCVLKNGSSFGDEIRALSECLIVAHEYNRTAVLTPAGSEYLKSMHAILPVSKCAYKGPLETVTDDASSHATTVLWQWPQSRRTTEPGTRKLDPLLLKTHPHPTAWWASQCITYLTRHQASFEERLWKISNAIAFENPVVGIDIRGADDVCMSLNLTSESRNHEVEEYMFFVEQWYDQLEQDRGSIQRIVYLASSDTGRELELRRKYPRYEFIDSGIDKYTDCNEKAMDAILVDIHFLRSCDYVICTMSSYVCRLVYDSMMATHIDAALRMQTLDSTDYFGKSIYLPWIESSASQTDNKTDLFNKN